LNRLRPLRRRAAGGLQGPEGLEGLDPLLARLYAARGVTSTAELDASLKGLAPIGSLTGVAQAAAVLAGFRQRKVLVVGDFDADGATSTALVVRCLREFGFTRVDYLVPNRFEFGYGLSPELVLAAAAAAPDLLLTVDSGTSCIAGAAQAARLGMDVLITDHHLPGPELPRALAIVNPNLPGSGFRSRHLAGVGVAFYLMAALGRLLEDEGQDGAARIPAKYLDLVALGTVADVVTLDRDNRILVAQGLARIRAGSSVPGIAALMNAAGRDPARTVSADLGFAVGPRLNAAGRLEDMALGIECLLTDDPGRASGLAGVLDAINSERREIEAAMRGQAFAHLDALREPADPAGMPGCICVYDRSWHQGVVGLVASRLKERCHRPVIAFAGGGDGELKGSARSIPGVHVRDLLEAVSSTRPGLIRRFGGHAMAAGLSLGEGDLDEFSRLACEQLARLYPSADFSGALLVDGELPAASISLPTARMLREAGPWGAGFPEPVFCGDFEVLERRTVGGSHLKLRVRPLGGDGALEAIAFQQAGAPAGKRVELVYRLDVNVWRGLESLQLVVEQIRQRDNMPFFSASAATRAC
jgi:single-stranded-DNA-specific exonuclease